MSEPTKSDQIEVGALWNKEGKTQKFLSGNLNFKDLSDAQWQEVVKTRQVPVVIFTNKFKQKDSHPDLRVYLSKPKAPATPTRTPTPTPAAKPIEPDNEII